VELLAGIEGCGNMPFGSLLIFVSFWSHHVSGLNLLLLQTANTHGYAVKLLMIWSGVAEIGGDEFSKTLISSFMSELCDLTFIHMLGFEIMSC
jgi:hypothetical protein